ncbi:MAG: glycoside hydrolase family 88 protein [Prolixibacteraceae bacterium]|jgi:unsaturated rhamnogalacturonyl hydrolase|nr:glycoside hydrolase family 88 protein [Prolixibacteraceae bacterium]
MKVFLLSILSLLFIGGCKTQNSVKPFWPKDKSPELIGQRVMDDFFTRGDFDIADSYGFTAIHYAEVCAAFGVARLAGELKNEDIINQLSARYMRVITDSIPNTADHVDANVYGILPFELYRLTGEEVFLNQALDLANVQWDNPRSDGLSNQTRFWIDDVWMIGSLQTQAYRITGNPVYIQRAAIEIDAYLARLQKENGLFFHGPGIPFHWGRGNGWVAAGLAEIISELPEDNPHYESIVSGYRKMMAALVRYQSEDGMWRQLIDKPEAWNETSASAMFGYAITLGVKSGLLTDQIYTEAYQKAWLALCDYVSLDGKVTDVCVGTGQQNDINYYLNRPKITGDFHGQAPLLWFAWSLLSN